MVVMWAVTTSPRSFPLASTSKFSNTHRRLVFFLPLQTFTHLLSLLSRLIHTPLSPPLPLSASIHQHRQCITPRPRVCFASSVPLARRRLTTEGRPRSVMSSPQKKTTRPFDIHRDDSANSVHHVSLQTLAGNCRKRDLTDTCSCRLK